MSRTWRKRRILGLIVSLIIASSSALAHDGATGIVKERMELMKSLGASMKTLGSLFKSDAAYNPILVSREALAIEALCGEKMTSLFPDGSLKNPSEAVPAIWENWTDFKTFAVEAQSLARSLASASKETKTGQKTEHSSFSPKQLFGMLAKNCAQCHETYRMKKR